MADSITIVGASLAGLRGAETLRNDGYDGRITVIGDETGPPYDRPPLSKQLLAGKWEVDRTLLYREDRLAELDLDLQFGVRATGLDLRWAIARTGRSIAVCRSTACSSRPALRLACCPARPLSTGCTRCARSKTRSLFGASSRSSPRVVVVGAGFIGAEVAATARERGLDVTMIEALPVPLGRVLGDEMGGLCGEIHRDHGVDVRLGVGVDGFDGHERVERVRLSDGSVVEADVVIVGVGVAPNTGWLDGSGLTIDNGVVCDATCLAAPGVTAAGDVARWPNHRFDEVARVEHWDHAIDMGAHAARRLLQSDAEATAVHSCAVLLERPIRPQDPARRTPSPRRRRADRHRIGRRATLRRHCTDGPASSWRCSASIARATWRSIANSSSTARASTMRWRSPRAN